jgi:soluble lytic murein transglycosylase-like protein
VGTSIYTKLARGLGACVVALGVAAWPRSLGHDSPLVARVLRGEEPIKLVPRDEAQERLAAEALRRMPELGEEGAGCLAAVIVEEASDAGLDPLLVFAIIEVESGWEPDAVSQRGAHGLMQLRPGTLEGEARDGRLAMGDPHDPVLNIRAGVRYFRRMVRVFGNPDLALVAYNTGPTRLSSYLRAVGEVPDSLLSYARRVRREERRLRRDLGVAGDEILAANVRR